MAIHIDELSSEVAPEPEPAGAPAEPRMDWQEQEHFAELRARHWRDQLRVAAEGFDD